MTNSTILIIDDDREMLKLISLYLRKSKFDVATIDDTQNFLERIIDIAPDLILLDVMMPKTSGFQVCKEIKNNQTTTHIPVIFMTARSSADDKVMGLEAGAVDYLTKPFNNTELLARINTHLTISQLQQDLQAQIAAKDKLIAELDAFAHTVAHDLKTPLTSMVNYCQMLLHLHLMNVATPEQTLSSLKDVEQLSRKTINIVDELLLLSSVRKQAVILQPVDMTDTMQQVRQRLAPIIEEFAADIQQPTAWPLAMGYAPWVEEVWVNYVSNGIKYGGRPPHLELGATPQADGFVRFWVKDNGRGLTSEAQSKLFAEFSRLAGVAGEGHGLGLSIVRRIAEKLGGQVGVESAVGQGSTFYFTLPQVNGTNNKYDES